MTSFREHLARYFTEAARCGLSYDKANALRRDAQRLHTWGEHECNGVIERVEDDGRTDHRGRVMVKGATYAVSNINGPGPLRYWRTPDRETGCLNRIKAIAASINGEFEYQGDPRGWPVHIRVNGVDLCPPVRS